MAGDQQRAAMFPARVLQQIEDAVSRSLIKGGGRLVGEHHARLVGKGTRYCTRSRCPVLSWCG